MEENHAERSRKCERCDSELPRRERESAKAHLARRFCSRRCSKLKLNTWTIVGCAAVTRLASGEEVVIDAADLPRVATFRWWRTRGIFKRTAYAIASGPLGSARRSVWMHRLILGVADGLETDHVNGNGLDNRRQNLRACTRSQNRANVAKVRWKKGASSQYKGVSRSLRGWRAKITSKRAVRYLGDFRTEIEAANAYDAAALRLHGEFARPNKPK